MKSRIASYDATGFTPIGLSLKEGARDLPSTGDRTIILVSDGIDTCAPPPPCKIAKKISRQGVDLRIDTVGFQVDPRARAELECIARVAKGSYVDANSAAELAERLELISARALRRFSTTGTPVMGAPATDSAPLLESGQFTDSIVSGEDLFYAVELQPGQSLGASATLSAGLSGGPGDALATFDLELLNPSLEWAGNDRDVGLGRNASTVAVQTEPVGVGDPQSSEFMEAGTYYVHVSMQAAETGAIRSTEFPLELVINVTGEAIPSPSPSPSPAPSPPEDTDDDEGQAAPPPTNPGESSQDRVLVILGGVAFGLLGVALGTVAGRRVGGSL